MPEASGGPRCGLVAIVGRPNVGKSTLLNRIVGQKLSITSRKPQTTRHRILGIKTEDHAQAVYVDTPGLHDTERRALNQYMNREVALAIADVDLVLMVMDAARWTDEDEQVLSRVKQSGHAAVLAINKIDKISDKSVLLPLLQMLGQKCAFADLVPVCARSGRYVDELERSVCRLLPLGEHLYAENQVTDRSMRFLTAELVREKLIALLGQELPHALTVEVERFVEAPGRRNIDAVIWVERDSHKAIVIGRGGARLKEVGAWARRDIEAALGAKVMLSLWVKVKRGWTDDERAMRSLGYD